MPDRIKFPGLTKDSFVSDADRWALEKLENVPLLPTVIRKFSEIGFDRWYYCMNMSMSVRCGPKQYSSLYHKLQESCQILDMPEPELYVTNNPFPNAWAGGIERPYITLLSGIVDTMDDEQLYYLIGHELGHIKAEHVLYFNVGAIVAILLEMIGRRTFGVSDVASTALQLAFYEWMRQAEFSADRAGLLVSQSFNDCADSLLLMAGGRSRLSATEMDREAFLDQARAYSNADPLDQIGKALLFYFGGWSFSHPFPVARVQELERWFNSGAFEAILKGEYVGSPSRASGAA